MKCLVLAGLLLSSTAVSAAPTRMNFQATLRDANGVPVADNLYAVQFAIYDAPSGGNVLWDEAWAVNSSDGLVAVLLGSLNPIPDSVFTGPGRYIGITIESDPELTPREELVSVPYGFRVNSVDSALGGHIRTKVSIGIATTNSGLGAFAAGDSSSASGDYSTVSGGLRNQVNTAYSTVGGGFGNTVAGSSSSATIGGGAGNAATGQAAPTVSGGYSNFATGTESTIGGGGNNVASGEASVIAGGQSNTASVRWSTVGGGVGNQAIHDVATVTGGSNNVASGGNATVCGGGANTANGSFATIAGGLSNVATGRLSFAAGNRAKALHDGAFVWADDTPADFSSSGLQQFLVRATGGVGIGTNDPKGALQTVTNHDANPTFVVSWDKRHVVIGGSGNSGGLGISYDQTNQRAYVGALSPNTAWRDLTLQAGGGRVGIGTGTATPSALLHVNGTAGNNTGVWSNLSDRRLKRDIQPLENALATIELLEPVTFRWKDEEKDAQFGRVRGLIAQDVEKVIPEWVKTDPDGHKRIEPVGVDALLIEAIQELKAQNQQLQARVAELEREVRGDHRSHSSAGQEKQSH